MRFQFRILPTIAGNSWRNLCYASQVQKNFCPKNSSLQTAVAFFCAHDIAFVNLTNRKLKCQRTLSKSLVDLGWRELKRHALGCLFLHLLRVFRKERKAKASKLNSKVLVHIVYYQPG